MYNFIRGFFEIFTLSVFKGKWKENELITSLIDTVSWIRVTLILDFLDWKYFVYFAYLNFNSISCIGFFNLLLFF